MTQVGEGQDAVAETAEPVMTFGAPTVGEVLAERYQLEEHVNNDSAGRQVWRGVDVVLRRPVAVVLRHPGGDSATEMLQAAVAASRVIHPNLVGVYDAIDEGERAYVVREWVDGEALREVVAAEGPLDPERATTIVRSIGDAVAAVHATGMVHGNVHPGTTLIGDDGRVVLADARADSADSVETDIRAIGGVLYYALTGHWPHAEAGPSALPDAVRDGSGAIAAPRQVRAGVPAYLDDLTMDLLDARLTVPSSDVLAAELGRLDAVADDHYLEDGGPLRFSQADPAEPPRANRKIAVGVAALLVIALVGLAFGINAITGTAQQDPPATTDQAGVATGAPQNEDQTPTPKITRIPVTPQQVRIVDPEGDRQETDDAERIVDGDPESAWETARYRDPLNKVKTGMGVLIDLGSPRTVQSVRMELSASGASAELRAGTGDPGATGAGDKQIVGSYKIIGQPKTDMGSVVVFPVADENLETKHRYLLVWITDLPRTEDGGYKLGVQEIVVDGV